MKLILTSVSRAFYFISIRTNLYYDRNYNFTFHVVDSLFIKNEYFYFEKVAYLLLIVFFFNNSKGPAETMFAVILKSNTLEFKLSGTSNF